MTRNEQRQFVREALAGLRKELLADVARVPAHWDGHELRAWIADRAREGLVMTVGIKALHYRQRTREYENDRAVGNF